MAKHLWLSFATTRRGLLRLDHASHRRQMPWFFLAPYNSTFDPRATPGVSCTGRHLEWDGTQDDCASTMYCLSWPIHGRVVFLCTYYLATPHGMCAVRVEKYARCTMLVAGPHRRELGSSVWRQTLSCSVWSSCWVGPSGDSTAPHLLTCSKHSPGFCISQAMGRSAVAPQEPACGMLPAQCWVCPAGCQAGVGCCAAHA